MGTDKLFCLALGAGVTSLFALLAYNGNLIVGIAGSTLALTLTIFNLVKDD